MTKYEHINNSGMDIFSKVDERFAWETEWAVRKHHEEKLAKEHIREYAEWLKKALSDYIDAALEKNIALISDSEK